jgi:hypothetical protein
LQFACVNWMHLAVILFHVDPLGERKKISRCKNHQHKA